MPLCPPNIWTGQVSNLGLRGKRPVTYRPKNGTARHGSGITVHVNTI